MEHSIAAKYAARPAAHFVRPSARTRERRLGLHPAGAVPLRRGARHRPAPPGRRARSSSLRGRWRADPARAGAATGATGRPRPRVVDALGPVRSRRRRSDVRAPPRRRGAAEDRDRHLGRRDRRPPRGRRAVAGRRQPSTRARRPDLDPPQGHARARRDHRGDRPARGRRGDRARRSGSPARSTRSSTASSSRGTRIHKTVHYFLMEPTGGDLAGHDHEFDEVRWIRVRRGAVDADVRDRARARGARPRSSSLAPDRSAPGS